MKATLEDRVVIVTGGGGGIGRGLVRGFAARGARVVVAEYNTTTMAEVVDEMRTNGADALGVETDVADRASIVAMVEQAVSHYGRVDGLVNNAMAIAPPAPASELTEALFDLEIRSGLYGSLWAMQAVYPHMRDAGFGRIVNVASASGLFGFIGQTSYAATKEAIRSLTRTASREWFGDGITINVYAPSSVGHYATRPGFEEHKEGLERGLDIVRGLSPHWYSGDAEQDIAPAVAFLLSEDSRYVTGQTITLDAGTWIHA